MSHGHAIRSKKAKGGKGVYGSPEVLPIISAHTIIIYLLPLYLASFGGMGTPQSGQREVQGGVGG
jgi:hypothetical protein